MNKYYVTVLMTGSYIADYEINAATEEDAQAKAYELAYTNYQEEKMASSSQAEILDIEYIMSDNEISDEQDAIEVDNARRARELK